MTKLKPDDMAVVSRIIAYVIGLASIVQILGPQAHVPASSRRIVALTILVAFIVVTAAIDLRMWWRHRRKSFPPNGREIAEYLCDWLESGGRAAVFSRELGWVQSGSRAEKVLLQKARDKKLVLCIPSQNDVSERLERAGAEVYTYPGLQYAPRSRFTIINFDRGDSRVTAGGEIGGRHVMHESETGEDPFLSMAHDLISIVRASAQRARVRR
jgi:hypothetical protein